ncbi:MAG TPA: hemolysin family protein [Anaerolineae bacterium]|nr:hemolysin family protein [Anaerolineae bacterium]
MKGGSQLDAESSIALSLIGLSLLLTAFASAAEAALTLANPFRVKRMAGEEIRGADRANAILEREEWHLSALLILKNAALIVAACLTTVLSLSYAPQWGVVVAIFSLTLLVLFLCRLLPRTWAMRDAEKAVLLLAIPIRWLSLLLYPVVRSFRRITNALVGDSEGDEPPKDAAEMEEELRLFIDAGEEEGYIEENEREMIASVCDFDATLAREIMVPRIDMVALEADASIEEALDVIVETGYSRIPVYEGTIENILGILNAKDLLANLKDNGSSQQGLRDLLRPAHFVPETNKVGEVLRELQRERIQLAIVVDEYGGIAGLVTVEDALEEIVGEIEDEYDTVEPFCEMVSDQEAIFNARIDLDDVNSLLDTDLPTEDSDTLGGLIYSSLGGVPKVGDEVELDGVRITVLSLLGRRIKKVRVVKDG